jgi:DNA-binding MarR family transcriptional regulator
MEKDLAEELYHQMIHCMNLMRRNHPHNHPRFADRGLQFVQGHLLKFIAENKGISQKELLETHHVKPASLSELLSKLEQKGYIARTINKQDKRLSDIQLTKKGEEAVAQYHSVSEFYFSALTGEEQKQLLYLLEKVVKAFGVDHLGKG